MTVFLSGERPGDKPKNALGSLLSATALKRPASLSPQSWCQAYHGRLDSEQNREARPLSQ